MTALRWLDIILWGAMALYMARGAWAAARGKDVRRGDPMRLACFATGVVMIGFNLRALYAPGSDETLAILLVLSAFVPFYIIRLGRVYGRGPIL